MTKEELKRLRLKAGLTQQQLADELGIERSMVGRWETKGSISKVYIKILTNYLKK